MPVARFTKKTRLQGQAISALLLGRSYAQVAEQLGCDERSIRRWLQDPGFAGQLQRLKDERIARLVDTLDAEMGNLVAVLFEVAAGRVPQGGAVRVAAVKAAGELWFKARENLDLSRRVTALEAGSAVAVWGAGHGTQ